MRVMDIPIRAKHATPAHAVVPVVFAPVSGPAPSEGVPGS